MKFILLILSISFVQAEILATVNGHKITLNALNNQLSRVSDEVKKAYENDLPGFLEEMINQELLYQKAKALKIGEANQDRDIIIKKLLDREVISKIKITETEMKNFYNEHKSELKGAKYNEAKYQIQKFLKNQKAKDAITEYIEKLKKEAKITRNKKWLNAEKKKLKDPVKKAIKNGLPTVVDFGANNCIPCNKMKPIIKELKGEYKGKANVILIDVRENQALARNYRIMLIPTQIFFNKKGKELHRHIGFFPKDSIIVHLKDCGLE